MVGRGAEHFENAHGPRRIQPIEQAQGLSPALGAKKVDQLATDDEHHKTDQRPRQGQREVGVPLAAHALGQVGPLVLLVH